MLVAIYAYEQMYGGLHGMNEIAIVNVKNLEEAEDYATEMSYDVMDSYSIIIESFENEAEEAGCLSGEFEEYIEDSRAENVAYELWIVTDTKGKTIEELESEFYNNKEEFIENYCEKG